MSKGNEPAFPSEEIHWDGHGNEYPHNNFGLTKREYFAAMAMQGLMSNKDYDVMRVNYVTIAEESVSMADALLKELEK